MSEKRSPWAPFGYGAFALIWTAGLVSNVGTWMHEVSAGWLMTTLTDEPTLVALVQALSTLPIFLFALPAGALADILNRRKLMLAATFFLAGTAFLLGFVVNSGGITPMILLVITFILGSGIAVLTPAWHAIVPSLVEKKDLLAALSLNSIGINISRAIGPGLAGFIIVTFGLAYPFFINGLSYVIIFLALLVWQDKSAPARDSSPERPVRAILTGISFARKSVPLKNTIKRALLFFLFASAFWALLPLIAKDLIAGGPSLYSYMMASIGMGAVAGALVLPKIRQHFEASQIAFIGSMGTVLAMLLFALSDNSTIGLVASFFAGLSWITCLTSFHISAQTALPEWIRARGLSVFIVVFFGALSLGSISWGGVASLFGIREALFIAAGLLLIASLYGKKFELQLGDKLDIYPSSHWPAPAPKKDLQGTEGPILVTVLYRVVKTSEKEFLKLINTLKNSRLRDGAYKWELFEDVETPGRFVESFRNDTWADHLRMHKRVSGEDKKLQEKILKLLKKGTKPTVTHMKHHR